MEKEIYKHFSKSMKLTSNFPKRNLFIILMSFVLVSYSKSLYFDLYSYKETCFTDEFVEGSVVILQYRTMKIYDEPPVAESGFFKFKIHVVDMEIYKNQDKKDTPIIKTQELIGKNLHGKLYYVVPETNIYMICVQGNSKSFLYKGSKDSVKFNLAIETNDKVVDLPHDELPKNDHLKELQDDANDINSRLNSILHIQIFTNEIEDQFSELQKQNNNILFFMTIFQIILIVGIFFYTYIQLKKAIRVSVINN